MRVDGLDPLVANLAAHGAAAAPPTVDDAQSADEPSLQFVTYLCRRLDALPVAVVLAVRAAEGSREPLHALGAEPGVLRLRPDRRALPGSLHSWALRSTSLRTLCSPRPAGRTPSATRSS